MLDALSASLDPQRQLVADASRELLTTVRTNVEVLSRVDGLQPDDRVTLIRGTVTQLEELTRLVDDLTELARGDGQEEPLVDVSLDELTQRVVDSARRHHPSITFHVDVVPTVIRGQPNRVSRALTNLLDNAAKWSPAGSEVDVTVRGSAVTITDRGPGIDPDDCPMCSIGSTVPRQRARCPDPASAWRSSDKSPTATAAA
jgi:signal transduction histidine kinase